MRLRRLIVLELVGFPTSKEQVGGGSRHLRSLLKIWSRAGMDVHLIQLKNEHSGQSVVPGVISHEIAVPRLTNVAPVVRFLLQIIALSILCRRQALAVVDGIVVAAEDSVVLSYSPYLSDVLLAATIAKHLQVRAAVHLHHLFPPPWWHPFRRGGLLRTSFNWGLGQLALTIIKINGMLPCVDEMESIHRSGWKFSHGPLRTPLFLDSPQWIRPASTIRDIDACFLGRLTPAKGMADLVPIWSKVVKQHPGAKLVLGGPSTSERLRVRLRDNISRTGLGQNIVVAGVLNETEKVELLSRSRLFLFPSYEEGWSLAVMEAAYYGALPVVYDLPAYDYLDPVVIRIPAADIGAYAEKVSDLLNRGDDFASERAKLKELVLSYNASRIAMDELESLSVFARGGVG